jgi:hypothetical protein
MNQMNTINWSYQIQTCLLTEYGWLNYGTEYLTLEDAKAAASQPDLPPHYSVRIVRIQREVVWNDRTRL